MFHIFFADETGSIMEVIINYGNVSNIVAIRHRIRNDILWAILGNIRNSNNHRTSQACKRGLTQSLSFSQMKQMA